MIKLKATFCLCVAILLVSCTNVPDNIISRTENESVTESLESKAESDLVFDTVENVTKDAASVLGNKYQNIVLPDEINVDIVDTAYILTCSRDSKDKSADLHKLLDEFSMAMVGEIAEDIHPDRVKVPTEEELAVMREQFPDIKAEDFGNYDPIDPSLLLIGDSDRYHLEAWSNYSLFGYVTDEWFDTRTGEHAVAVYDPRVDDLTGITYPVGGKDYAVSEAYKLADDFVKNKLRPILPFDEDARAKRIAVYECNNGNYYYFISFEHICYGLPLSNVGEAGWKYTSMAGIDFRVAVNCPDVIGEVRSFYYPTVFDKRSVDKLITLDSALAHAEKLLAPYDVYIVKEVALRYCSKEPGWDEKNEDGTFEYHPMWCLTVWEDPTPSFGDMDVRKEIYIDAVTGETMLWDDLKTEFVFDSMPQN